MSAVTQAEASVVGSVLVFVAAVIGLYVQNRRGIAAQRGDHAATAQMVREVRDDLRDVKQDVRDMREEVRDVKGVVRSHDDQLHNAREMTDATIRELDELRDVVRELRSPTPRKEAS